MKSNKEILPFIIFSAGIIILLIPVFSMNYLLSLDGPAHFYNALIFNDLLSGGTSEFYTHYAAFNTEFTPNLIGLVWTGMLFKIFTPLIAIKIFNISYILLFSYSQYYCIKGVVKGTNVPISVVLLLPFISTFFVISGFINFYTSFIFLFLTAGVYVRIKKFNWKNILLLIALTTITYLGHSIVFGFLMILLGAYEITKHLLVSYDILRFFKATFRTILIGFVPLLLTFTFLRARETEVSYLTLSELIYNLFTIKSLHLFESQGVYFNSLFATILIGSGVGIGVWRLKNNSRFKQSDFLIVASILFLLCYFILPDSVGFASVFSVRISYLFWLTLACWLIVETPKFQKATIGLSLFSLLLIIWNTTTQQTEYKAMNSIGKEVINASEYIEEKSIVYPIFASNVWNHYHFNNLLALQKPLLLLENTCARQDYFPIQYKQPYEKCLEATQTLKFICHSQPINIDYLFVMGNESVDNPLDQKLLDEAKSLGAVVIYHTNFIKIYKVR